MSDKLNNHFVARFSFRLFNGNNRFIHVLNMGSGSIIRFASIKGQCARHKFYGSKEMEDSLERLEGPHSAALKRLTSVVWSGNTLRVSDVDQAIIREAVMLQRARTPRTAAMMSSGTDKMLLYTFREYVAKAPDIAHRQRVLDAIDRGEVRVRNTQTAQIKMSIDIALRAVKAISDLRLVVLRNRCDYSFLFSDAPVIFYNRYLWDIQNHGVLGYFSPGLMILWPIDPRTQILLFDPSAYRCHMSDEVAVDIVERCDVSQLNALQLHSAQDNVYFADVASEEYVMQLFSAHRPAITRLSSVFAVRRQGDARSGELLHFFEPQLPVRATFSFLEVNPLSGEPANFLAARNRDIARELMDSQNGRQATGMRIDGLFPEIVVESGDGDVGASVAALKKRCELT